MISNQILQSTLDGIKEITTVDLCVCNTEGKVIVQSFSEPCQVDSVRVKKFVESDNTIISGQGFYYFKIFDEKRLEYILIISDENENVMTVGQMAAFQLQSLLVAYKERFDRDNFMKNLLLDNLLLVDIYNRAKKLHIQTNARRVVFVLETPLGKDNELLEIVRSLLVGKNRDFVTAVDERDVIIVKEVADNEGYAQLRKTAQVILDAVSAEKGDGVYIAIGTIVKEIKEVSRSYKEARMALDVGRIFFENHPIVTYSTLGIGRLIYQLPISLCKMFIREIFDNKSPEDFDEETLTTINKFFANSLNVSETSRQLYIHRNTLVYRLDKLQKNTGLDLRVFEDAITFKIALMVAKYMKYMEEQD